MEETSKKVRQREMKFRCWDKQTKQMSPSFTLFGEFLLIGAVHAWQYEMGNKSESSLEALDDLKVMQHVGMNDKNGKPIFEGDIIKVLNNEVVDYDEEGREKMIDTIGEVFWQGTGFVYSGHSAGEIPLDYNSDQDIEVLGNIYQDSHLLSQGEIKTELI